MIRKLLTLGLLLALLPVPSDAKSYGSGGRSYSSRSSSGGGGGSHSFGSGKSYSSGSGRSYSSGSSSSGSLWSGSSSRASSGSGSERSYSSGNKAYSSSGPAPSGGNRYNSGSGGGASSPSSGFTFDQNAARAQKQAASKRDFTDWQRPANNFSGQSYGSGRSYSSGGGRPTLYVDHDLYRTRTIRIEHVYAPYYSRPLVIYHDHYSSFFWWWLLDRSLDERAMWAYSHRADMDSARYQALLDHDANLEARIHQLEAQHAPADPGYTPTGLDRDLMYNDQYVNRAYHSQPTFGGRFMFWFIMAPTAIFATWFLGWLLFFKRWQTA